MTKKGKEAAQPALEIKATPVWILGAGVILAVSAVFLFGHLGVYSLWDDEAETALGARGILQTGDTTALLGHNLHARRAGITLRDLHDRLTPPLASYLTAASFYFGKQDAWFARLPFALCGLASVALMLLFLWKAHLPPRYLGVFGVALLCQVPFFLYCRQDRYYGCALFLAIAIAYVYLQHWARPLGRQGLGLLMALLFLAHPLICVQVAAILATDWLLFGRREQPFKWRWFFDCGLPIGLIVIPSLFVWNPFLTKSSGYLGEVTLGDRWTLLLWNIRDLFTAEFMPCVLVFAAILAYLTSKNRWLLRIGCALGILVLVTSVLSYQRVQVTNVADVRYVIVAIPLGLALSTLSFGILLAHRIWGWFLMVLLLGTNLGSGKFLTEGRISSVPIAWWNELLHPIEEPYRPVADWIRKNVPPRATIWVEPDYMMYPLMFHAPEPVYAWQLENSSDPQWAQLDPIHFKGRERPQYVIVFGPSVTQVLPVLQQMGDGNGIYQQIGQINCFWKDLYRPEVFWRSFRTIQSAGRVNENVYIFHRRKP